MDLIKKYNLGVKMNLESNLSNVSQSNERPQSFTNIRNECEAFIHSAVTALTKSEIEKAENESKLQSSRLFINVVPYISALVSLSVLFPTTIAIGVLNACGGNIPYTPVLITVGVVAVCKNYWQPADFLESINENELNNIANYQNKIENNEIQILEIDSNLNKFLLFYRWADNELPKDVTGVIGHKFRQLTNSF